MFQFLTKIERIGLNIALSTKRLVKNPVELITKHDRQIQLKLSTIVQS